MHHPILMTVMRILHITSAIAAVGGLIFAMVCVTPAVRLLEDSLRDSLLNLMRKRFLKVQAWAIAGLVVSGVYTWMVLAPVYRDHRPANALIGIKVLLAMILFGVVWARSANIIKSEKTAQMINIHLAALILILGATLRTLHL